MKTQSREKQDRRSTESDTVRVFVGAMPEQSLAVKVLEYSIRKATNSRVAVVPLYESQISIPLPRESRNQPRTPFSFQRFLIPELCGFRGRAIYLDSDMLVFRDILELWNYQIGESDIIAARAMDPADRRPQFSVMMLNNERLLWQITDIVGQLDRGQITYNELMYHMKVAKKVVVGFGAEWNSLEYYRPGETALLHYTDMQKQPWIAINNENGHIWCSVLLDAIGDGFISKSELKEQTKKSWIRPSLVYQAENQIIDSKDIPNDVLEMDKRFRPLYLNYAKDRALPLKGVRKATRWMQNKLSFLVK